MGNIKKSKCTLTSFKHKQGKEDLSLLEADGVL